MPMVKRAPKQVPADGVVECTDTMETPLTMAIGAVVSAGVLAYGVTHIEESINNGGVLWLPLLGTASVELLFGAGLGYSYVRQCQDAKRLGAEQLAVVRHKDAQAKARAEAGTLWKRAFAAARADDCMAVRELDPQIRDLDVEFHDVVFARDVAIASCLAARE
ncbi:MAG TPA: hypothetical protein VIV11_29485 [Kofleriaceae bacterium]